MMQISNQSATKYRNYFIVLLLAAIVISLSSNVVSTMPQRAMLSVGGFCLAACSLVGFIYFQWVLHSRLLRDLDRSEKLLKLSQDVDTALAAQLKI